MHYKCALLKTQLNTVIIMKKSILQKSDNQKHSSSSPFFASRGKGFFSSQTNKENQYPNFTTSNIQAKFDNQAPDQNKLNDKGESIAWFKFNMTFVGGIKIIVIQDLSNGYKVKDVSSNAYGVTFGYSWDQTNYIVNIKENLATIDVYGVLNYNAFGIEGVGTIYSEDKQFRVKINTLNGEEVGGEIID